MDYLIAGAEVFENIQMRTNCSQNSAGEIRTIGSHSSDRDEETRTNCSQILPTNESQVRPLTKLSPQQQREVWQQAIASAGGKVPSSREVKDIVDRIRERTQIPIAYQVGDVCEILVKDNPDLRGLGGCWCIVAEVREFSCVVRAWSGEYTVREENLKDLGYSAGEKEEMGRLWERLFSLRSLMAEAAAGAVLSALGKWRRPELTPLESELLGVLERNVAENAGANALAQTPLRSSSNRL
jgi:hypothetical protein